ncbi:MAG: hypothetical protein WDN24_13550 [Sphingomonas sp.]
MAAALATPAAAAGERWVDFGVGDQGSAAADVDSLKIDGDVRSFRVRLTPAKGPPSFIDAAVTCSTAVFEARRITTDPDGPAKQVQEFTDADRPRHMLDDVAGATLKALVCG